MTGLTAQSWFWWATAVILGVPVLLVGLTQLHSSLKRRGSTLTRSVDLVRWVVVPAVALIVLLTKTSTLSTKSGGVRLLATVLGLVVLLLVLALLNYALFANAAKGSWRERLPSIFVDITRLIIVGIGLAVLFSVVWGTDVGGLFAALGVTSIVLGLSLQGAVGSIVSGLLVLFEQPFTIGDWLQVGDVSGRVVEVNWRSVHISTDGNTTVIPNATLATASFRNLSRPQSRYEIKIATTFGMHDRPDQVCALLDTLAAELPGRLKAIAATTVHVGPRTYKTTVVVATPADADPAVSTLRRWAWYASRREGLHLDGGRPGFGDAAEVEHHLRFVTSVLHIAPDDVGQLAPAMHLARYGAAEVVQRPGQIPPAVCVLVAGRMTIRVPLPDGGWLPAGSIETGELVGQSALSREPVLLGITADEECTLLVVPRDVVATLVPSRPQLARDLGMVMDERRARARAVLEQAGYGTRARLRHPAHPEVVPAS